MLVALSFVFVAYQMVVRIFFGVMVDDIMNLFNMSLSLVGIAAGVYYFSFALSSIITGLLFMRYNFISVMIWGNVMMLIGLICYIMPDNGVLGAILGRFLVGVGSGMSLPFYLKVFSLFYNASYIKILVNYVFLNCMVTLSLSLYFIKPYYNIAYGYYDMVYAFIGISVIIILLLFISYLRCGVRRNDTIINMTDAIKCVKDYRVLLLSFICGLFAGSPDAFSDLWSLMFFEKCCNIVCSENIMIFFWLSYAVSGFVVQYIYKSVNLNIIRYMQYIGITIICIYLLFFILAYCNDCSDEMRIYLMILLVIVLALCCGYKPFVFGNIRVFFDKNNLSQFVVVLVNAFCMFFGQIFHIVIGCILDHCLLYLPVQASYIISLSIIPLSALIGMLLLSVFEKKYLDS